MKNIKKEEQINAKPLDLKEARKTKEFIPYPISKENIKKQNLKCK